MKRTILSLLLCMMICISASAAEIPPVKAIQMRAVSSEEEAIAYAQEVWQYGFIAGYRENLQWCAVLMDGLYEIYADDAQSGVRALSMAVRAEDGYVAYLLNVESQARQAADHDTNEHAQDEALMNAMEQFAQEAFAAFVPGLEADTLTLDSFRDESKLGENYFFEFWQRIEMATYRHIYLQVAPVIRVAFWVDMTVAPPSEVWERLEPNMGNG